MSGTLRIAVTPFYGNRIVLPRLSWFHALYPDIRVEPETSATQIDVHKTDLDGGLLHGTGDWPGDLAGLSQHRISRSKIAGIR